MSASPGRGDLRPGSDVAAWSRDDFQRDLQRRKRERWAKILAAEPPGRTPGRRPRDPEQERILLRLDQLRLERRDGRKP